MPEPAIRDAGPGDLSPIVAIYNQAIPGRRATADTEPVTADERRGWFGAHTPERHPIWVAEQGSVVVGWLSFQPFYGRPAYAGTAELSVYVAADVQGRGVGRALLARALQAAPALGLTTLLGFIFGHNAPSLRLFGACGFSCWGTLPGVARLDGVERDLVILGRRA